MGSSLQPQIRALWQKPIGKNYDIGPNVISIKGIN
jgi:hypothetical protein